MTTPTVEPTAPLNTSHRVYGTMTTKNGRVIMDTSTLTQVINKGGAGITSTIFNIIKSLVGSGILTLGWATANVGLIPFILLISLSFSISFITWMLLVISSQHLQVFEYRDLALKTYGHRFARFNDVLLIIFPFFICVLYAIFTGQFIHEALTQYGLIIYPSLSDIHSFSEFITTDFFIITICIFLVMFPLSLLPKLDYLKYSSLIGLIATFFTVGYIAYCFFIQPIPNDTSFAFNFKSNKWYLFWLESFATFTAAYFGHFNTGSLYGELQNRSVSTMLILSAISFILVAMVNFLMAIPSYLKFGEKTPQNIIAALSGNIVGVLRILMAFSMIGSYPLLFWNSKISMKNLIPRKYASNVTLKLAYLLMTVFIWLLAVNVSQVGIFLSFFVSLAGNLIVYIFPAMMYYKVLQQQNKNSWAMKVMCYGIVCFGVICSVGGTLSALLNFVGYD